VGTLVAKSYLCAAQPQPSEVTLVVEAAAWEEAQTAAGVPETRLVEVYQRAIGTHTGTFRLTTGELIATWHALRGREVMRYLTPVGQE